MTARQTESPKPVKASGPPGSPGQGHALGKVGFWVTLAAGWTAFIGLMVASAMLEGEQISHLVVIMVSPALLSVILALRRRDLADPDRPVLRAAGLLLLVGFLYAVASALLTLLFLALWNPPIENLWMGEPAQVLGSLTFFGIVLYAVLIGFLMWSESLERIQESRTVAAREAVLRAEAEAKALRAQFNPHFVFNTLHSLMLLVREDPGTAERAIEDVASLIRYASTLERRGQDTVALGQELEMARRYLSLEALRLEDRLQVDWEVDGDLEGMAVPAFALQTLLENAIKHGLSPKEAGGRIFVALSRDNGGMLLRVEDDGMGSDPSRVGAREGSGLRLLERRLEGLYGGAADLVWRTAPGEGFRVELRWPASLAPKPDDMPGSGKGGGLPLRGGFLG